MKLSQCIEFLLDQRSLSFENPGDVTRFIDALEQGDWRIL